MQILNVEPIVYDLSTVYTIITVACFGFALVFAVSYIADWEDTKWRKLKIIFSVVMFALTVTGTVFSIVYPKFDTGRNRYEVIFNDDQSIQDVYDKYIVVKQRGEIWVLEDREGD